MKEKVKFDIEEVGDKLRESFSGGGEWQNSRTSTFFDDLSPPEFLDAAGENKEGLELWARYEESLKENDKELAEKFRNKSILLWESAVEKGNADAMKNLEKAQNEKIQLLAQ